ncbi:MAG TPA: SH3 domain-containing protein [Spirochaetota bacterium]|nr:SH3 domain-containing protein [Spirochaetota bacterium]HOD15573.1 SH3 domain-containing protein [Spirochaetota bacterium]HPG49134.1 SH3 domain-containing protein [Spirochaetota bacterium]HPN13476.1 SH3 domain-containing protein [Spirochaetota bacterium]HQL82212.1 SH3 domain-containing protein [Spirochaetota bacterium]
MRIIILFQAFVLLFLFNGPAGAAQRYAKDDLLVVLSGSGLNIREKADMKAKVLAFAPCGALVTMEGEPAGTLFNVGGIEGRWARVTYRDVTGYAFDGFLSRLRAPEEGCESLDEYYNHQFKSAGNPVEKTEAGEGTEEKTTELAFSNGAAIVHRQVISQGGGPERSVSTYTLPGIDRVEDAFLLLKLIGYLEPGFTFPSRNGKAGFAKDGSAIEIAVTTQNNELRSLEMKFRKPDFSGQGLFDIDMPGIVIRKEGEGITIELRNIKR